VSRARVRHGDNHANILHKTPCMTDRWRAPARGHGARRCGRLRSVAIWALARTGSVSPVVPGAGGTLWGLPAWPGACRPGVLACSRSLPVSPDAPGLPGAGAGLGVVEGCISVRSATVCSAFQRGSHDRWPYGGGCGSGHRACGGDAREAVTASCPRQTLSS
jgi:hypothetical protein